MSEMIAVAAPDTVYSGRLYAAGANPELDDPMWECDHQHGTEIEALTCAIRQRKVSQYKSRYAHQVAGSSDADLSVLDALDESFRRIEATIAPLLRTTSTKEICDRKHAEET